MIDNYRQLIHLLNYLLREYTMKDLSAEWQRSVDISTLLKSKKQHYEQQVQKLISYIGEEYRQIDPLALLGKRFREKEEEFSSLRRENQELLLRTKNLAEDIQKLRCSQDSGIHWQDLRISLQNTQKLDNVLASKEDSAFKNSIYSRLQGLDSDLLETRALGEEEAREYDKVIEWAMTYLTRDRTAWRLANQVKQVREGTKGEDMVLVPRKRYEQLVKIYSINIAEASINQYRKQIMPMKSVSISPEIEQKGINYIEEVQRTYYQNYSDIARDENFDVKDLNQLFQALAKKVGFENEWKRYHSENQNDSVRFKHKIDSIFQFDRLGKEAEAKNEDNPEQPMGRFEFRQLLEKFDKLIDELPFERAEKKEWKQLSARIKEDSLISMNTLIDQYHKMQRDQTNKLLKNASSLIYSTLQQSINEIFNIVSIKLKMEKLIWGQNLKKLMKQPLFQAVQAKMKDNGEADLWLILHEVATQKVKNIFSLIRKNFFFITGANLYNAALNKK